MSGGMKLKSTAGGSTTLVTDDTLVTDEEIVVQDPIGVNQAWTDVVASRAINTEYTNNTGRPIEVSVQVATNNSSGVYLYLTLTVDGLRIARASAIKPSAPYAVPCTVSCIVPNGSVYKIEVATDSVADLQDWMELR